MTRILFYVWAFVMFVVAVPWIIHPMMYSGL